MKIADLILVPAPGEPDPSDSALASDITQFEEALGRAGSRRTTECFSGNAPAFLAWTGDYLVTVTPVAIPALTGAVGFWLQARLGRKVSLRIGEIEAQASTVEEVERLLAAAKVFREEDGGSV